MAGGQFLPGFPAHSYILRRLLREFVELILQLLVPYTGETAAEALHTQNAEKGKHRVERNLRNIWGAQPAPSARHSRCEPEFVWA